MTLERITGETLAVSGSDDVTERLADINRLKEWWINKKHGITTGDETPAMEAAAEETEARNLQEEGAGGEK